jgi:hypothetical protein
LALCVVVLLVAALSGCAAVAGIFKAGVVVGVVVVLIVVGLLFALFGGRG